MIEQLKTIQAGLAIAIDAECFVDKPVRRALLDAVKAANQLEAMAREPVAWIRGSGIEMLKLENGGCATVYASEGMSNHSSPLYAAPVAHQYEAGDMASASAQGFRDGVASVAQQPYEAHLLSLLARIHRDGGHYTAEHGIEKSVVDADLKVAHLFAAQEAQQPQVEVGNNGFDHKTAADFLSGKTVSDEAVRKFVQASRWAHDDRASLQSMLLSERNELASREAEIALLKKELMDAEAAPQQSEAVPSDVVRDAERYRWLRNESWAGYNTGKGTPSVYTVDGAGNRRMMLAEEAMDDAIDAAIAQQKGQP